MTFLKRDLSESSGGNAEAISSLDFQRGEFARNSRNVATIGVRSKLYETEKLDIRCLSVVEIRDYAMNFLGGMATQEKNWDKRGKKNAII